MAIFGEKISLFLGFWPLCLRWPLLGLAWKVLSLPQNVLKTRMWQIFCKSVLHMWLLLVLATLVFENVGSGSVVPSGLEEGFSSIALQL